MATWADTTIAEIRLARQVLGDLQLPATTVFVGGGTPTRLPPAELGRVLQAIRSEFGVAAGAEVTVEANPDDVTEHLLAGLLAAGANRISLGMQSAVPETLQTLDRTHRSAELPAVADRIRRSGMDRFSVDLIYGTPGESQAQLRRTLEAAVSLAPGHISAYCLGIEPGTRMGAQVRAGALAPVDQDAAADRYLLCDEVLAANGYSWYEISNWARPGQECRHNLAYWQGDSWWGVGPGAHSHIAGVRWWNRRHPRAWSAALAAGDSPAAGMEALTPGQQRDERVLLGIRLRAGLPVGLVEGGRDSVAAWVEQGWAEWLQDKPAAFRLTRRGRLIADRLALEAVG